MEYIKIGKILNTKGIKGELKIKSLTDFENDRFKKGNEVFVYFENKYLKFKILKYTPYKNSELITFQDYEDINLVEKYKGSFIFTSADNDITLLEDEYYLSELVGIKVYQEKKLVGEVVNVLAYPQGDYLDILTINKKHALVPFREEFVLDVVLKENYLNIVNMEGLI